MAKGACVTQGSQKHLVPNFENTKVHCKFLRQRVRNVDSRQQTMSIDMTMAMKWWDPSVKYSPTKSLNESRDIFLSPSAIEKIWTPDLVIKDLTALKFRNEWISMISSKVLVSSDYNPDGGHPYSIPNIEVIYHIKSSVYCSFDHAKYPMDRQECNVTLGSNSFGAILVLEETDQEHSQNHSYTTSNFLISSNIFDN